MPEQHHKVKPADDVYDPVTTPYGPHHGQVDEAAGGADSSPFENEPSGRRLDAAETPPHADPPTGTPRQD